MPIEKLTRNLSTLENREFWRVIEHATLACRLQWRVRHLTYEELPEVIRILDEMLARRGVVVDDMAERERDRRFM